MNLTIKDLLSVDRVAAYRLTTLSPTQRFKAVSTDSRTVKAGDLFIALKGEKFDGHDFIKEVSAKGIIAAVVNEQWYRRNKKSVRIPCVVVENTLDTYGELARSYRRKFSLPILAIAGSNGKTTTKDVIAHLMSTTMHVLKTEANFNNQVGLPQMLFRLRKDHELAVLEIGTNHPGEIAWLTNVAEPTHALVTNIGREHLEFFKNLEGVAREELSALAITDELGGFGFLNLDDPYIRPVRPFFQEWCITYGGSKEAQVRAKSLGFASNGKQSIEIRVGTLRFTVRSHIIADYAANMLAAATAVGLHFGLTKTQIRKSLESYVPHSKRMEIEKTPGGVTIINDAYNANPESFASALATLKKLKGKGKKYIAAGDMFELGKASTAEHRKLGQLLAGYSFNGAFFTGAAMKHAHRVLDTRKRKSFHGTKEELIEELSKVLRRGDTLLVKGSRGMKMEEIVTALRTKKPQS